MVARARESGFFRFFKNKSMKMLLAGVTSVETRVIGYCFFELSMTMSMSVDKRDLSYRTAILSLSTKRPPLTQL